MYGMSGAAVDRSGFRFIRSMALTFVIDWAIEFFSFTLRCHLL